VKALAHKLELPRGVEAQEPPEARGLTRGEVGLMVATRHDGAIVDARFRDLPQFLEPGDLLVVNTSATLPAALHANREDGSELELRLSTPAPGRDGEHWWVIELRRELAQFRDAHVGEMLALPDGGRAEIVAPFASGARLWLARLDLPDPLLAYLDRNGHPVRYDYVPREWPIEAYQNVYALEPGSAEMASAGRPFTAELVTRLVAGGVHVAPITLHTGVSSPELGEPPYPERYRVPAATAQLVNAVHEANGSVVAVGTTVVRAIETVATPDGEVFAGEGWTNLVLTRERGLHTVDGLLTGWHEPEASHLELLRAVAPDDLIHCSYEAASARGYRWHEFGDSHLILP
jgi:S-adenosylmethionine:tRNA ribosyltransferase-isomerase